MSEKLHKVFLRTYNEVDALLRRRLSADARVSHAKLIEQASRDDAVIAEVASQLHAFRALRNAIVHTSQRGDDAPIAEPHASAVEEYRNILRFLSQPPRALDWIATRDVYTAPWSAPLPTALAELEEHGWDALPIVDAGRLEGVYTLAALQRWLVEAGELTLQGATFDLLRPIIGCGSAAKAPTHGAVRGVRVMPEEATVPEIEAAFRQQNQPGNYLLVVCFTASGRWGEPLRGIVTPHNLPSANPAAHGRLVDGARLGAAYAATPDAQAASSSEP